MIPNPGALFERKRFILMMLLDILQEYTDSSHPMTKEEIRGKIEELYGFLPTRNTVYERLKDLNDAGYEIQETPKGCYLVRDGLQDGELRFLIDHVLYSDFVTRNGSANMIEQLAALGSPTLRQVVANRKYRARQTVKSENQSGILLLELIQSAIFQKKQISCNCFSYCADGTTKNRYAENLIINPYELAYKNGKYYLLGALDISDQMLSWRVDKLCDLEILHTSCQEISLLKKIQQSGGIAAYVDSQPQLCGGEVETFKLQCAEDAIDEIVDVFGKNFELAPEQETNDEPDTVILQVKATRESMKAWAITHADRVVIISPEDMKESIQNALHIARRRYLLNGESAEVRMTYAETLDKAIKLSQRTDEKKLVYNASLESDTLQPIDTSSLTQISDVKELSLTAGIITDPDFLKNVPLVEELDLIGTEFPSVALRDLPHLTSLTVSDWDEDFPEVLRNLKNLTHFSLSESSVQDLSILRNLPDLKSILLQFCPNLTDCAQLLKCRNLTNIHILGCETLTDFSFLKKMKQLRFVTIFYSKFTASDAIALQKTLRDCHIRTEGYVTERSKTPIVR